MNELLERLDRNPSLVMIVVALISPLLMHTIPFLFKLLKLLISKLLRLPATTIKRAYKFGGIRYVLSLIFVLCSIIVVVGFNCFIEQKIGPSPMKSVVVVLLWLTFLLLSHFAQSDKQTDVLWAHIFTSFTGIIFPICCALFFLGRILVGYADVKFTSLDQRVRDIQETASTAASVAVPSPESPPSATEP